MTKEETINAIADDKMMPFIQPEQLAGIVDFVIKNYNPSLPSNLDEAARDYARASMVIADAEKYKGFIAGAEWQKQKMEKEAVEVVVVDDWQYGKDTDGAKPAIKVRNPDWKIGDKKKVIILKEE